MISKTKPASLIIILILLIGLSLVAGCVNRGASAPNMNTPIALVTCTKPDIQITAFIDDVRVGKTIGLGFEGSESNIETILWRANIGDLDNKSNDSVEYTAVTAGLETITLEVTNNCGETGEDELEFEIRPPDTVTPTPSHTPTVMPSITPTPSFTPTATPQPTVTFTPTTVANDTDTANTTSTTYPRVRLISAEYLPHAHDKVLFKWEWDGILQDDMYFALRMGPVGGEEKSQTWTKETDYTLTVGNEFFPDNTIYNWHVVVIRDIDGDKTGENGGWEPLTERPISMQIAVPPIGKENPTPTYTRPPHGDS